jgi:hypothetical protein
MNIEMPSLLIEWAICAFQHVVRNNRPERQSTLPKDAIDAPHTEGFSLITPDFQGHRHL